MLDVIITRYVGIIIQIIPGIVVHCLYNAKGNKCGDHFGIKVT